MKKRQFLGLLEEKLEQDPGTLDGPVELRGLEAWDSLAVMSFIVLVDQHFGLTVTGDQLAGCKTVDDLAGLLGDRIEP